MRLCMVLRAIHDYIQEALHLQKCTGSSSSNSWHHIPQLAIVILPVYTIKFKLTGVVFNAGLHLSSKNRQFVVQHCGDHALNIVHKIIKFSLYKNRKQYINLILL